ARAKACAALRARSCLPFPMSQRKSEPTLYKVVRQFAHVRVRAGVMRLYTERHKSPCSSRFVPGVVVKRVRNGLARYCAERADLDAVMEVDYVLVRQPDASRGDEGADG